MVCLIRDSIRVGEFSNFFACVEALEHFGKVGDFVVGNFEIATKTTKGIFFKPRFQKPRLAFKSGERIILSSLI